MTEQMLDRGVADEREEELERSLRPALARRLRRPGTRQGAARHRARRGEGSRRGARPRALRGPAGARQDLARPDHRRELGVCASPVAGPALERKGDIAAILTALEPHDVLFIDEIHRLNPTIEEILYPALEDFRLDITVGQGPAARTMKLDLPPFTLVGATTRTGLLTSPLRDRFRFTFGSSLLRGGAGDDRPPLSAHPGRRDRATGPRRSPGARAARPGLPTASCAACATSPRWRTLEVTTEIASQALERLQVDSAGLDRSTATSCAASSRSSAAARWAGDPRGALGEQPDTIEDVYEPYLLQLGFLQRTPRGRVVTELGRARAGSARADSTLF